MPELPEVEVVRRGLQAHVVGKTITAVRVHHPRAVRRHEAGPADLTARLLGARIAGTDRRGKYLWLLLDEDTALVVHLGMSGQMLLGEVPRADHVRISALLDDGTVLTENSAILQYIADQYPEAQLAPPASDRVGRAKLRQWLSFISAELHKGLMTPLLGDKTPAEVKAWAINKYAPRLAYLDAKLKDREFLLDRFSVADAYLATILNWTQATPEIDLAAYPNVKAYLERMRQRPSVAAALGVELPLFRAEIARRKAA